MSQNPTDVKKAHIAVSLIILGGRDGNRTCDTRIFNPIISIGISLYLTSILA